MKTGGHAAGPPQGIELETDDAYSQIENSPHYYERNT